jgi:hypothetical protein
VTFWSTIEVDHCPGLVVSELDDRDGVGEH